MANNQKRFVMLCVWIFICALASAVSAGDEKKIVGTVAAAPEDPNGKLAPIVLQTEETVYQIAQNAISDKIKKKWIGKKVEITGIVEEKEGNKIVTPWLFIEAGAKAKPIPSAG